MQLYYWQGHARNFGDELNTLLWPVLLPDFFDDNAHEIFLGIGSVLDSRHPTSARKIVAGAGYGGYQAPPVIDARWTIHWVRGPRTARQLGVPASFGVGDPGSLIDRDLLAVVAGSDRPAPRIDAAFMPHFETACHGAWERAAAQAGVTLIDPRGDPREILAAIAACRLLISEALHGVIVADALRVPWVAVAPMASIHSAKWDDWAAAMALDIDFARLAPSSFAEQLRLSSIAGRRAGRTLLDRAGRRLQAVAADHFTDRAAASLRRAAMAPPRLTDDRALERSRDRMRTALALLRQHPLREAAGGWRADVSGRRIAPQIMLGSRLAGP